MSIFKSKATTILFIAVIASAMCGCNKKPIQWEYKVITIKEDNGLDALKKELDLALGRVCIEAAGKRELPDPTSKLNEMGEKGWELVDTYTTTETVFPNYGDPNMHVGMKSNTRTSTICFVFKRPKQKSSEKESKKNAENTPSDYGNPIDENGEVIAIDTASDTLSGHY